MTEYQFFDGVFSGWTPYSDGSTYSLGLEFYATAEAFLKTILIVKANADIAYATCRLWRVVNENVGVPLTDAEMMQEGDEHPQRLYYNIPGGLALVPGQRYRAAVCPISSAGDSQFLRRTDDWDSDRVQGIIVAPSAQNATGGHQGSYAHAAEPVYPTLSNLDATYFVDVLVSDDELLGLSGRVFITRFGALPATQEAYRWTGSGDDAALVSFLDEVYTSRPDWKYLQDFSVEHIDSQSYIRFQLYDVQYDYEVQEYISTPTGVFETVPISPGDHIDPRTEVGGQPRPGPIDLTGWWHSDEHGRPFDLNDLLA